MIKNDTHKRSNKSSTLRYYVAKKYEQPQQRKTRRPRWKGDTKNMKKVKTLGTSNMDDSKRKQQRRKKKKKAQNVPQDEVSCAKRRIKYLLLKMKLEQNLTDEYSGDGLKGQMFVYQIPIMMGWEYDASLLNVLTIVCIMSQKYYFSDMVSCNYLLLLTKF